MTAHDDDMARLRERPGISRADYETERKRIAYKHARVADTTAAHASSENSRSAAIIPDKREHPVNAKPVRPVRGANPRSADALTKRQLLWAMHFAEHGDPGAAAIAAGYSPIKSINRAGENARHPGVLAKVRELVQLRQSAGAPFAVGIIEQLAAGDFGDARKAAVQLKAAVVMANTAGVGPIMRVQTETHTTVEHHIDIGRLTTAWADLERAVGSKLPRPSIIDVTPTESSTDA